MKKAFTIVSLSILSISTSFGQSTFGFNFNGWLPTGELKSESPELWGGGFEMELALHLKKSPFYLGTQFGFSRYGSEVRDGDHGSILGNVRIRRNNEIGHFLGLLRVKPETKSNVQPYLDFFTGINYVYTRSYLRDDAISEVFDSSLDLDDVAFNYGAGAGIEFLLNRFLSLDLHFKTLKGSRTKYLTPRSVTYDPELEGYEFIVKSSRFSSISFGFGLKVLLSHVAD